MARYDENFKQNAIKYYYTHRSDTYGKIASDLGVSRSTIERWIEKDRENEEIKKRARILEEQRRMEEIFKLEEDLPFDDKPKTKQYTSAGDFGVIPQKDEMPYFIDSHVFLEHWFAYSLILIAAFLTSGFFMGFVFIGIMLVVFRYTSKSRWNEMVENKTMTQRWELRQLRSWGYDTDAILRSEEYMRLHRWD